MPDRFVVANFPDNEVEDNGISTTKYTAVTFVPKNLYEQFSKAANMYFLVRKLMRDIDDLWDSEHITRKCFVFAERVRE